MNALEKLIGQLVVAEIEIDEKLTEIEGTVINVDINDFYFYEKNEPIYISVNINPTKELPEDFDYEDLTEIPISNIRKA